MEEKEEGRNGGVEERWNGTGDEEKSDEDENWWICQWEGWKSDDGEGERNDDGEERSGQIVHESGEERCEGERRRR